MLFTIIDLRTGLFGEEGLVFSFWPRRGESAGLDRKIMKPLAVATFDDNPVH